MPTAKVLCSFQKFTLCIKRVHCSLVELEGEDGDEEDD